VSDRVGAASREDMRGTVRELLTRAADRLCYTPSRAAELAELRGRFALAPGPERLPPGQVARARRLVELREQMGATLSSVESCGTCSRGQPSPDGRWPGGFCCAGRTEAVFADHEIASLKAAGVEARSLTAPKGDHAGCAFRGPTGCSLGPAQRPNRCLRHLCSMLRRELGLRGDLALVDALGDEIEATLAAFSEALARQLDEDAWRETEAHLERDLPRPLR
jgi:hypothetical protein